MKKPLFHLMLGGLLGLCLVPTLATAQSAFDGTWKVDLKQMQMPSKPDVLVLKDGMYHCTSCTPPVSVKADGEYHKVTGHPYYDMLAVKVVDARTVQEMTTKDGKPVSTSTTTVAADGKSATFEFTDDSMAEPVSGHGTMNRVGKGPAGSHALSGSWRTSDYGDVSENALIRTYKTDGDTFSMSAPTGESYTARIDGTKAAYVGDPGVNAISVKKLGDHVMQETYQRDGKVTSVAKMTVSPDGKTMRIAINNKQNGSTMAFVAAEAIADRVNEPGHGRRGLPHVSQITGLKKRVQQGAVIFLAMQQQRKLAAKVQERRLQGLQPARGQRIGDRHRGQAGDAQPRHHHLLDRLDLIQLQHGVTAGQLCQHTLADRPRGRARLAHHPACTGKVRRLQSALA